MPLFQSSVLKKYIKQQDQAALEKAYQKFTKYFHNTTIQENIKEAKEEQFQEGFLRELFVNILGYTLNPNPNYNLTTEYKNVKDSKKTDGAIIIDGKVKAVIELKGTNIADLAKIESQAFGYKNNQPDCTYVVTSNFEKVRFYIDNAIEHLEFNLFTLSLEEFQLLYLCLAFQNIQKDLPKKVKESSLQEEEAITKKFYQDYSLFKREMYRDLVKLNMKNEVFRAELTKEDAAQANKNIKLTLFKKSQKLIDRFLFIFFAEDRDLLPPNSTKQILEKWNADVDFGDVKPLYNLFKLYFTFLDQGRAGTDKKEEIFAYNGGLFKPDAVLDSLEISNELLYKHTDKLQSYNFESEVDVNILGHIFENSLNEIESINAEIEGTDFDKQKTKRKKDGVFYTPKYITKYIVDNTVGKLCEEKKAELGIDEAEYQKSRKGRTTKKLKELQDKLEAYRAWLLQITICDPACGSGAFLNQALNFLIEEHTYIDELNSSLLGISLVFPDIENTILENNIYGVDINEESVEIAKLSLWLRTAQPRRKLNDLNNNIKCGNSLIDDPKVAGNKAFNWQNEFPHVFEKGGFDVIIGNPPYVRIQNLDYSVIDWLKNNKETAYKRIDISTLFIEEALKLINNNGLISFITSNQFFKAEYGRKLREFIKYKLYLNIDYSDVSVFEGLATYVSIINLSNKRNENIEYCRITDPKQDVQSAEIHSFNYEKLDSEAWDFNENQGVKDKIYKDSSLLGDCADFVYGIITGNDNSFVVSHECANNEKLESEILIDFVKPENYKKYGLKKLDKYIIYPYNDKNEIYTEKEMSEKFPNTFNFLSSNKIILENRKDSRVTIKDKGLDWYVIMRRVHPKDIKAKKIIFYDVGGHPNFFIDYKGYAFGGGTSHSLCVDDKNGLSLEYLLALLNSSLLKWVIIDVCPVKMGGARKYGLDYMKKLPIKVINEEKQTPFINCSKTMILLTEKYINAKRKFVNYIQSNFSIEKLPKKLQNWYELSFVEFIKELNKAIKTAGGTPLTKIQEMEWMEVFETKKAEAVNLKAEIDKTDAAIDQMVYELYDLTEEEIKIVEESTK